MKPLTLPLKRLAVVGLGEVREKTKDGQGLHPKGVGANLIEKLSDKPHLAKEVLAVSTDLGKAQQLVQARGVGKFSGQGEQVRYQAVDYTSFLSRVLELDPEVIVFCAGNTLRQLQNPDGTPAFNPDGTPRLPSRLELLAQNAPIAARFGSALQGYAGKVLVAANPTDLLSLTIYLSSGKHHLDVLGLNNLDTARFRQFFLDQYTREFGFEQQIPFQDVCTLFMIGYHDANLCLPVVERQHKSSVDLRRIIGIDPLSPMELRMVESQAAALTAKSPEQAAEIADKVRPLFSRSVDDADVRAEWRISRIVEQATQFAFTLFKHYDMSTNPDTADEIISTIEFLAGHENNGETRVFSTLVKPASLKEISSSRESLISKNPVNHRYLFCGIPFRRVVHPSGQSEVVPMLDLTLGDAVMKVQDLASRILAGPQKELGELLGRLEMLPGGMSIDQAIEGRARPQITGGSTAMVPASIALPSIDRQIKNSTVRLIAMDKNNNGILRIYSASSGFAELKSVTIEGGLQYLLNQSPNVFGVSKKVSPDFRGTASTSYLIQAFDDTLNPTGSAYELGARWPRDVCQARSLLYVLTRDGAMRCHTSHSRTFNPVIGPSNGLSAPECLAAVQARDSRNVTVFLGYGGSSFAVGQPVETEYERLVPVQSPGLKCLEAYVTDNGTMNLVICAEEKTGDRAGENSGEKSSDASVMRITHYTIGLPSSSQPASSQCWGSGPAWGISPSQMIIVTSRPDNTSVIEVHSLADRSSSVIDVGMPAMGRIAVTYPHAYFRSGNRFAVANLQTGQSKVFQVPLAHADNDLYQWVIP